MAGLLCSAPEWDAHGYNPCRRSVTASHTSHRGIAGQAPAPVSAESAGTPAPAFHVVLDGETASIGTRSPSPARSWQWALRAARMARPRPFGGGGVDGEDPSGYRSDGVATFPELRNFNQRLWSLPKFHVIPYGETQTALCRSASPGSSQRAPANWAPVQRPAMKSVPHARQPNQKRVRPAHLVPRVEGHASAGTERGHRAQEAAWRQNETRPSWWGC